MSSAIISLLVSHILTFVEGELAKEEPQIIATITQDIQLLITKLESLIAGKSSSAAAVVTPVLNVVGAAATAAVEAAGEAVAQSASSSN